MCVPFSKISLRSSHILLTACTNPQIPDGSQESAGADPRRVDGGQGTGTDQADAHIFTFTTLCIFPPADGNQGNREHSHGPA